MEKRFLTPAEITAEVVEISKKKEKLGILPMLLLGIAAGAFIAFAAEGSNMAAFNLLAKPETYGLGRSLAGAIFGTGLMLVIIAGGELFTGNTLMLVGLFDKKITVLGMLRNWLFVYIGNLIGSLLIAFMMSRSGLFGSGAAVLGGITVKIAYNKTNLPFDSAFYLGVMCNWLVCGACWMSYGAKDIAGKVLVIFFAIWLFITSGFEHSVANMYYIPAGILAKTNEAFAAASGLSAEQLQSLNWGGFFAKNLLPVTLGNIVGGGICVGGLYWLSFLKKKKQA